MDNGPHLLKSVRKVAQPLWRRAIPRGGWRRGNGAAGNQPRRCCRDAHFRKPCYVWARMLRRTEGNEDGKKFSRSKYELPWRLRNESLAQDPMKVAAHIAPNAINAAGERPLKPNWHSMANGDGMSRWHLTSRCTSEQNGRHRSQDQQEGRRDIQEGRSRNRRTSPTGRHSRERYAPPSACRADARSCGYPRTCTRVWG